MPFLGNIGPTELIIVLVIALVVLGPGKLPEVGSALGKSIREFRKAATDVKDATSLEPIKADAPAPSPAPTPVATAAPMTTPAVGSVAPTVPAPVAAPPVPADSPAADPGSEAPAS